MQGRQPRALEDRIEQCAEVAEAGDDLGMFPDVLEVEEGERLHRAVSPAQGQDHIDSGIFKRPVELLRLLARRRERRREFRIQDVETQLRELADPAGKITLFFDQITWRYDEDVQGNNLRNV
jgi:hypothetical protein